MLKLVIFNISHLLKNYQANEYLSYFVWIKFKLLLNLLNNLQLTRKICLYNYDRKCGYK